MFATLPNSGPEKDSMKIVVYSSPDLSAITCFFKHFFISSFLPDFHRNKNLNPLHQPFTKGHHITLQSIKSEAITMLKVVILAMCFEGDITFVISELKAKASLREFTGF